MFQLSGVIRKLGISASVALSIATFAWTYLHGVAAVNYGYLTIAALIKKAAVAAGCAGIAGLVVTAALAIGLFAFKKKLKLGKNKFVAW
ncbi:MAG: hypothetical protein IKR11_10265 [Solobacterium sp.]|nr:hypothetical protein [Solobacterium sp.]